MCHIFFVKPITDGRLGWFQVFPIVNSVECAHVFIIERFIILWVYNCNGIAGSNEISISRSLKNRHTVFHNGWTNLHSHQWCKSVPISLHPLQHLLSPDFLMITILTWMRWYLNVVLICISLMTSDDEHFFICLLVSYTSSFEKCLFIYLAHFWMGLFFYCKSVLVLCRFWISALCHTGRCKNFFPFCWLPIHSSDCFFCRAEAVEFH